LFDSFQHSKHPGNTGCRKKREKKRKYTRTHKRKKGKGKKKSEKSVSIIPKSFWVDRIMIYA